MRFLILYIIFILAGCAGEKQPELNEEPINENSVVLSSIQIGNAGIETDTLTQHIISEFLNVNGLVDVPPQNMVSVSFPLGGYLRNTKLLPGLHVRKGEIIGTIEDQSLIQLQQDFLMARSRMNLLEKTYDRQKVLNENKVSADKIFQQAEEEFQSQKILVSGLAEKLRLIKINPDKLSEKNISRSVPIYSPIDGFVASVNVNIGKFVNPSDVLFELINPKDIHASLTVFEKDLAKVKPGQKVWVTFVDDPTVSYECNVLLVTRNVNENRSGIVHCHFEEQPARLLPGMFLNARIELSAKEMLAVPEEAVVRYINKDYVLEIMQDSIFHLRAVETGIRENGLVEIADNSEAKAGSLIVTKNPYPILSKMKNTEEE